MTYPPQKGDYPNMAFNSPMNPLLVRPQANYNLDNKKLNAGDRPSSDMPDLMRGSATQGLTSQ